MKVLKLKNIIRLPSQRKGGRLLKKKFSGPEDSPKKNTHKEA